MESGDDQLKLRRWMSGAALAVTSFMLLFGVFPLVTIIRQLLVASDDFGSSYGWLDVAGLLWQSSTQAALSTGVTLMLGLPIAFLLGRFEFVGRRALQMMVMLPFVLPTMVTGLGLRGVFEGFLPQGLALVIVGHAFVNIAVIVRFVGSAVEQLDQRLIVQARSLGATVWESWRTVGFPLLKPAIVRSALLVFGFCFSSLSLVLVLGARNNRTFETEVLRQVSLLIDFRGAAINTAFQFACIALVLSISTRLATFKHSARWGTQDREPIGGRWSWRLLAAVTAIAYLIPFAWLAGRSVSFGDGFSLEFWHSLLQGAVANIEPIVPAVTRSLTLALSAAIMAILIAALSASLSIQKSHPRLRRVGRMALLPMMLTSATVGLGVLLSFSRPPFEWQRGGISLVLAQSLLAIPIAYSFILNKLEEVDDDFRVAAASLGASDWQAWWTTYGPTLAAAALSAVGLATALSMGEFGAASFLSDYQSPNLTVLLMRLLGKPGEAALSYASVIALMLAALALACLALSDAASRQARKVRA